MKKAKNNLYAFGVFIAVFAVAIYFSLFHLKKGHFEKITSTPLIVTCILLLYVIYLIIFLFTNNPYNTPKSVSFFDFIVSFLLFWGYPILGGYLLADGIATYYTGTYGKLAPTTTALILLKEEIPGRRGRVSYNFSLYNNLLPKLSVDKESYEKAMIGQCVEIQYRTSFIGIYRDSWKFVKCPEELSPHLYQPSYDYITPVLSEKAITKEQYPQSNMPRLQKSPASEILERYAPADNRQ